MIEHEAIQCDGHIAHGPSECAIFKYGSREKTALEVQVTKDGQGIELKLD